jgi:Spy/CpxP family protein refolding chaperone
MKTLIIASAALLFATAAPSMAQTYRSDVRQWNQHERIERGIRSGRLTPREAARLDRQQDRVQRIESRSRYYNNGYIDPRSQQRIERIQDRAGQRIHRLNNNRRGW